MIARGLLPHRQTSSHEGLQRLNTGSAVVVGHSWGTLVAIALAQQHPNLVRSLVLLSGYYYPVPRFDVALAAMGATPVVGDILRYTLTPVLGALTLPATVRLMFAPRPVAEPFARAFPRLMMLRPWQLRASLGDGALMTAAAAGLQMDYGAFNVPTFVAAGEDDRIVDPWHSKKLSRQAHATMLKLLPGMGHMLQHLAPDEISEIVARAL